MMFKILHTGRRDFFPSTSLNSIRYMMELGEVHLVGIAKRTVYTLFILAICTSCANTGGAPPIVLYDSAPRPPEELSVIEIAKTNRGRGHPTLDVREIFRIDLPAGIVFRAGQGGHWSPLSHFGGLPSTQRSGPVGNPRDLPQHFEALPGTYRITYTYTPVTDRWGWRHMPPDPTSVVMEFRAGLVYEIRGHYDEEEERWYFTVVERIINPRHPDSPTTSVAQPPPE